MILQFADISKLLHKIYSFGFPVFTFFILGTRKGLPWNIAYFICLIVIFSNPGEYLRLYPYPMEGAARFCIVFVLIIMLSFTHEKVRERTQTALNRKRISWIPSTSSFMRPVGQLNGLTVPRALF
jgi:hypothetical protein